MRARTLGLGALSVLAVAAAAVLWIRSAAAPDEDRIVLRVSSAAGTPVAVFKTGDTLDAAQAVPGGSGEMLLTEGNYFLEAGDGPNSLRFPIPLKGFHIGPDADGSFAVTIRRRGFEAPPPSAFAGSRAVFVPGGHFVIGDAKNPGEPHFVWVTGFFIGAFEVTNGEFRRFIRDPDGYEARANWTEAGWNWKASVTSQATALMKPSHPDFARFGADDLPVVLVTWFEASAYGRWLTRAIGEGRWLFRPPTEAEWEKAARGPDSFDYGLGMALSAPEASLYNWKKNPDAAVTLVGFRDTEASYRPNRFGLYHVSGNASEWTQSVHRPYSARRPYVDDDRNADATPGMRVTRGGSWYSANTVRLHLAYREEFQPEMSSNDLGFRLAALPLPVAPTMR